MAVAELMERVRQHYPLMRQSEQSVADFFLKDPTFFVVCNAFDIAVNSNVSEPTVARFCRAIGFTGLKDLRTAVTR